MTAAALVVAAALLGVERACYVWIARAPARFMAWCGRPAIARLGEPVAIVEKLFYAFKVLQAAVFVAWCWLHADGAPVAPSALVTVLAGAAIVVGQILNLTVFYRLGRMAVFFGDRLGYDVPWCRAFPFSLVDHPQYIGAVLTIWGFFLFARFPHGDWYLLPALETVYYVIGALLEAAPPRRHVFVIIGIDLPWQNRAGSGSRRRWTTTSTSSASAADRPASAPPFRRRSSAGGPP